MSLRGPGHGPSATHRSTHRPRRTHPSSFTCACILLIVGVMRTDRPTGVGWDCQRQNAQALAEPDRHSMEQRPRSNRRKAHSLARASTGWRAAHRRGLAESLRPPDDAHWLCHTDQPHQSASFRRFGPGPSVHGSAEGRGIDGSPARDSGGTDTGGCSAQSVMAVSVCACVSGGWELGLVTRPHSGRISGGGEPAIGDAV